MIEIAELDALDPPAAPKKRKKSTSPTARTLAELRKRGWIAQVVERRLPRTFTTVDLFGVIDLVAIAPAVLGTKGRIDDPAAILGIQATTGAHHADRRDKILAEPRARAWIGAGGRLELWTWSKRVAGKAKRWTLRVEAFTAEDWPAEPRSDLPPELLPDAIAVARQRAPRIR